MRWSKKEENPLTTFQKELNHLFGRFFDDVPGWWTDTGTAQFAETFTPRVNVSETEKEIQVTAELPGIDEKDVEVTLEDDTLRIKGEKKQEKEEKGKNYHRIEHSYGSFERVIPLPVEVLSDKVNASFKKGLLTVTMPKSEKALEKSKRIEIKT
jgi:HSP20 family protein